MNYDEERWIEEERYDEEQYLYFLQDCRDLLEEELNKANKEYQNRYDWLIQDILSHYILGDDVDKYVEKFHEKVKELETENVRNDVKKNK